MSAPSTHAAPSLGALADGGARVTAEGLEVRYGDRVVLAGLDLHIPAGERLAVVGESGGGKTTLLRVLAGLTAPSAGRLQVTQAHAPVRVRVMFQEDRLLPWLTARDNAALGLDRAGRALADVALRGVGLSERAGALPQALSGGQRQRVALARALAHRPSLLLLDEPFGALDALTRADMHDLLNALLDETRATTVLVTHDIDEALKLADRVLVLRAGHVATDVRVTPPRPRRRADLLALREQLEAELRGHTPA